jgi:PhzF family phenazine biosynthesis protein
VELRFRLVNVFTRGREPLSGNPLCVFEDGRGLDDEAMQALAKQFNLSETTFILPSGIANARVRIFTPSYEMPFAGHPTLGTAHVCRAMGLGRDALRLEMTAGVIPVQAARDRWTLQANPPTWRECGESRVRLAAMLSLDPDDLADRPLWIEAGREQLVIPLASEAAVRKVAPRAELFAQVTSGDGDGPGMAYVFARNGPGTVLARFFFPDGNAMLEDPATGSATANLGGWHLATGAELPVELVISQGEQVRRPSTLYLRVDAAKTIFVSGEVVDLGSGSLRI